MKEIDQFLTAQKMLDMRLSRGLSQTELSDKLNASRTTYNAMERNRAKITLPFLQRLAKYYNVNVEDIVYYKEYTEYEKGYLDGTADAFKAFKASLSSQTFGQICEDRPKYESIGFPNRAWVLINILEAMNYKLYKVTKNQAYEKINDIDFSDGNVRKKLNDQLSDCFEGYDYAYFVEFLAGSGVKDRIRTAFLSVNDFNRLASYTYHGIQGCFHEMLNILSVRCHSNEDSFRITEAKKEIREAILSQNIDYLELKRILERFGTENNKIYEEDDKNEDQEKGHSSIQADMV